VPCTPVETEFSSLWRCPDDDYELMAGSREFRAKFRALWISRLFGDLVSEKFVMLMEGF